MDAKGETLEQTLENMYPLVAAISDSRKSSTIHPGLPDDARKLLDALEPHLATEERINAGLAENNSNAMFKAFKVYDGGMQFVARAHDTSIKFESLAQDIHAAQQWFQDVAALTEAIFWTRAKRVQLLSQLSTS